MPFKTRITELLEIEHPIVQGGMQGVGERGANLIFRCLKNTARVGKSAVSDEVARRLARPGALFADVADLVSGLKGRELLQSGDLNLGMFWAGMVQGLTHDIPPTKQLIDRIIAEVDAIVNGRLGALRTQNPEL